jgi:protocatechuate 3,4-dioxygenase beta subunit
MRQRSSAAVLGSVALAFILGLVLAGCALAGGPQSVSRADRRCHLTIGSHGAGAPGAGPATTGRVILGPGMALTPSPDLVSKTRGESLQIRGLVSDASCRPLKGAHIELWQANAQGEYGPPQGTGSGGVRCCYLQGAVLTDASGRYVVETIRPGSDLGPVSMTGHIHFWVAHPSAQSLSTELNFSGTPDANPDAGPVVPLRVVNGALQATFDIVLPTR